MGEAVVASAARLHCAHSSLSQMPAGRWSTLQSVKRACASLWASDGQAGPRGLTRQEEEEEYHRRSCVCDMSGSEASVGSMHNSGKRRVQTPAIEPASQAAKVPSDARQRCETDVRCDRRVHGQSQLGTTSKRRPRQLASSDVVVAAPCTSEKRGKLFKRVKIH